MNHGDAEPTGGEGIVGRYEVAGHADFAGIGSVHTGKDLTEGAFTSAVLADERVTMASMDLEADAIEREDAGETFGDFVEGQPTHGGTAGFLNVTENFVNRVYSAKRYSSHHKKEDSSQNRHIALPKRSLKDGGWTRVFIGTGQARVELFPTIAEQTHRCAAIRVVASSMVQPLRKNAVE
jgi:hypothetical protein